MPFTPNVKKRERESCLTGIITVIQQSRRQSTRNVPNLQIREEGCHELCKGAHNNRLKHYVSWIWERCCSLHPNWMKMRSFWSELGLCSWGKRLAQESNAWNHTLPSCDMKRKLPGIVLSSEQTLNRLGESFQLFECSEQPLWKRTEASWLQQRSATVWVLIFQQSSGCPWDFEGDS